MASEGNRMQPGADAQASIHAVDQQQIVQSLELVITRITLSLQDSEQAVAHIIAAVTAMSDAARRIGEQQVSGPAGKPALLEVVQAECSQVQTAVQQAITALQFYDLLSQRMQHVRKNLRAVVNVMQAPERQHPAMWQELSELVRSVYSLEQERRMCSTMFDSLPADEPDASRFASARHGDIEFF
jgi:hypothetical protein